ncbi:hypothetical protein C8D76_10221 [Pasteurella langaaensis DSM 22999]|uniref:Type IV secretion system putative lipoprotein virB7 n=1 Tax=Alitibacter langaaensis DSM 22999 TaxID=1122935 RepID=A0A2U0TCG1_9PAST|nr:membrane lipoprotein lipid attachment site-containing protein [Pasteurella langaaensis]PVX41325.1 hypothetical protein C8D76_10221 [Pasteurella langaaensis DSM 22999]
MKKLVFLLSITAMLAACSSSESVAPKSSSNEVVQSTNGAKAETTAETKAIEEQDEEGVDENTAAPEVEQNMSDDMD